MYKKKKKIKNNFDSFNLIKIIFHYNFISLSYLFLLNSLNVHSPTGNDSYDE